MSDFLKKIIRPSLKKFGLYEYAYKIFFSVYDLYLKVTNQLKRRLTKTAVILTYHRINTVTNDPHLLCVTPETFSNHLSFLKENYQVISLPEMLTRLQNKNLTGQEAVITLDDGYRDNLTNALPLLEKFNLPATIFITTGFLGQIASLPWDQEYSLADRATFLSIDEIKTLANHSLITIGAHTHTHPRLSKLSYTEQVNELKTCREILKTITKQDINLFAYPFGGIFDFTRETEAVTREVGFNVACTTSASLITSGSNLAALPRINVRNYPITKLAKTIYAT